MGRTIFICNALEDVTRLERDIVTDSPAASKKIFEMAYALRSVGDQAVILSMGRGTTKRNHSFYKSKVVRINGVPVIYAPFSHIPFLSQLLSIVSMPYLLFLLSSYCGETAVVFYNRTSAYITTLLTSVFLGVNRVLDLEDAELINEGSWSPHQLFLRGKRFIYDKLCSGGTILACSAMRGVGHERSGLCYYGAIERFTRPNCWDSKSGFKFLLGGTVSKDTGADLLIDAIRLLRANSNKWVDKLEFVITGKGDCIEQFEELAEIKMHPYVKVSGRLTDAEYTKMVESCDVGMALKPNLGLLANTTFPSKVVELSSQGLLVLTTNISDVQLVMGDGAVYLNDDDPAMLIESLRWILENPQLAGDVAERGVLSIMSHCSMEMVGLKLSKYIFQSEDKHD